MDKSSFPYRVYDRKPHPNIVLQVLEAGAHPVVRAQFQELVL